MNYCLYFSPTGGTKRATELFCKKLSDDFAAVDMTCPENRQKKLEFGPNDLVVMGCPVYGGRLPQVEDLWKKIEGQQTSCVLMACFGNRNYDDMLLEWKNKVEQKGFVCIAAAAVVIPHVYSDKLGAGRPDVEDEKEFELFAQKVLNKMRSSEKTSVGVSGNYPYKEWKKITVTPIKGDECVSCGVCEKVCPILAIGKDFLGDAELCIQCMKCVRLCPTGARKMDMSKITAYLESNYLNRHKNEFFY